MYLCLRRLNHRIHLLAYPKTKVRYISSHIKASAGPGDVPAAAGPGATDHLVRQCAVPNRLSVTTQTLIHTVDAHH